MHLSGIEQTHARNAQHIALKHATNPEAIERLWKGAKKFLDAQSNLFYGLLRKLKDSDFDTKIPFKY